MRKITDQNGREIDFDAAVMLMDDDIRESIHNSGNYLTDQEFYLAYATEHELKFDEEFIVN